MIDRRRHGGRKRQTGRVIVGLILRGGASSDIVLSPFPSKKKSPEDFRAE